MAARSVRVNLVNRCDLALVRSDHSLDHGERDTEPPLRIEPGTTGFWESESDGIATGTEGDATF